tara:strand:+ start:204 stop:368 length:165 start_codon:yes stop_codon:yes gene_type:complete
MTDIIVGTKSVQMTITYEQYFDNEAEMIAAIKGAAELRGLVSDSTECPNENEQG